MDRHRLCGKTCGEHKCEIRCRRPHFAAILPPPITHNSLVWFSASHSERTAKLVKRVLVKAHRAHGGAQCLQLPVVAVGDLLRLQLLMVAATRLGAGLRDILFLRSIDSGCVRVCGEEVVGRVFVKCGWRGRKTVSPSKEERPIAITVAPRGTLHKNGRGRTMSLHSFLPTLYNSRSLSTSSWATPPMEESDSRSCIIISLRFFSSFFRLRESRLRATLGDMNREFFALQTAYIAC